MKKLINLMVVIFGILIMVSVISCANPVDSITMPTYSAPSSTTVNDSENNNGNNNETIDNSTSNGGQTNTNIPFEARRLVNGYGIVLENASEISNYSFTWNSKRYEIQQIIFNGASQSISNYDITSDNNTNTLSIELSPSSFTYTMIKTNYVSEIGNINVINIEICN